MVLITDAGNLWVSDCEVGFFDSEPLPQECNSVLNSCPPNIGDHQYSPVNHTARIHQSSERILEVELAVHSVPSILVIPAHKGEGFSE
jgi:hypothetical protein